MKTVDLKGIRFNKLIAIEKTEKRSSGSVVWKCVCDCGNVCFVSSHNLRTSHTSSCGCFKSYVLSIKMKKSFTKHGYCTNGKSKRTYRIWIGMHQRCKNKKLKCFKNYGGREISVCEKWTEFDAFINDMGPCPEKMTLERINTDGNYEPGNCKWATIKEQQNNKRTNRKLIFRDVEYNISELADANGIDRSTFYYRIIKAKWPIEKAIIK